MKRSTFLKSLAALIAAHFLPKLKVDKPKVGCNIMLGTNGKVWIKGEGWRHGMYAGTSGNLEACEKTLKIFRYPRHGVNSWEYVDRHI